MKYCWIICCERSLGVSSTSCCVEMGLALRAKETGNAPASLDSSPGVGDPPWSNRPSQLGCARAKGVQKFELSQTGAPSATVSDSKRLSSKGPSPSVCDDSAFPRHLTCSGSSNKYGTRLCRQSAQVRSVSSMGANSVLQISQRLLVPDDLCSSMSGSLNKTAFTVGFVREARHTSQSPFVKVSTHSADTRQTTQRIVFSPLVTCATVVGGSLATSPYTGS